MKVNAIEIQSPDEKIIIVTENIVTARYVVEEEILTITFQGNENELMLTSFELQNYDEFKEAFNIIKEIS